MIGIYAIFRKSDNKCMYVGESIDIDRRIHQHSLLKFDLDTYYHKVLETFDFYDKQNQLDREAHWINQLNPDLNKVRNRQPIEELRKIYSERNKGKTPWNKGKEMSEITKQKMKGRIPWNKGKEMSEETKLNISIGRKGIKHSEETKQKMKGRIPWNKGKTGLQQSPIKGKKLNRETGKYE